MTNVLLHNLSFEEQIEFLIKFIGQQKMLLNYFKTMAGASFEDKFKLKLTNLQIDLYNKEYEKLYEKLLERYNNASFYQEIDNKSPGFHFLTIELNEIKEEVSDLSKMFDKISFNLERLGIIKYDN